MYVLHLCVSDGMAFVSRTSLQLQLLRASGKEITAEEEFGHI